MIKFYVSKIEKGDVNLNTGKAWTIEDVPLLWKKDVDKTLKQ